MSIEQQQAQQQDTHEPGEKWEFNGDVAKRFDDMLSRSIPGYNEMRELVYHFGKRFIRNDNVNVIDLGASRGESSIALIESVDTGNARYFLSEISEPMMEQMRQRFRGNVNVHLCSYDLRKSHRDIASAILSPEKAMVNEAWVDHRNLPTSLVLAILTLIFVPINFRQSILKGVYDGLAPGGAFIMVEKVLGDTAETSEMLVDAYHEYKNANGYSWDAIERKRAALEGVQVPVRHDENIAMLRAAGFKNVDTFWRHLNFVAYIAIKD